jgi:hypothetical protein
MTTQAAHSSASVTAIPSFLRSYWLSWTIAFALCLSAALVGIEAWQTRRKRKAATPS